MIDPIQTLKEYDRFHYMKDAEGHEHSAENGQFVSGGSGSDDSRKGNKKDKSISRFPETEDSADDLAYELRDRLISKGEHATNGDCIIAARILKDQFPGSETWAGNYEQNPEQYHLITKLGKFFIDITADQFGSSRHVEAKAFREEDMEPGGYASEYGGFRKIAF